MRYHEAARRMELSRLRPRMRPYWAAVVAIVALAGCQPRPIFPGDPLRINGRDGGTGKAPDFAALMRVGTAARLGGDYANALGVYRRASQMAPRDPAPFVGIGDTLVDMGGANEAIIAYNSALARNKHDVPAQRGLAQAYLLTAKPELALTALDQALAVASDNPQLLLLHGVTDDMIGRHEAAQAFYRRGLNVAPGDPALTVDLALSLALTNNYSAAIATLRPVATSPAGGPHERQTLAMIYGLQGDQQQAARFARMDLDEAAVEHNLAYYESLRHLSTEARDRAILATRGTS
jgi:Flp pilus assembly protein TadD